jgi:hypothetical protein
MLGQPGRADQLGLIGAAYNLDRLLVDHRDRHQAPFRAGPELWHFSNQQRVAR